MSVLTRKLSGRIAFGAIAVALAIVFLLIALRPASAAVVERVQRVSGDACAEYGYEGFSFSFNIPLNDGEEDNGRIFDETFDLEDDATLRVIIPSDRKSIDFEVTDVKVSGVFVFERYDQRSGNWFDYASPVTEDTDLYAFQNRNIKRLTFCYSAKAQPTISTQATASGAVGAEISDEATLTGGDAPSGDVTFRLYNSLDACDSGATPVFSSTEAVVYDSEADSYTAEATTTVNSSGTYYWVASYEGDDDNLPASGECGDTGETTVIPGLSCGDTITVFGDDGDIATQAVVERGESADDGKENCDEELPYTLEIGIDDVTLLIPPDFVGARLLVRIDWADLVNVVVPDVREVDYDAGGPLGFVDAEACADTGGLTVGQLPTISNVFAHPEISGDEVPVCLAAQVLNGFQVQYYSVKTDPQWK